MRKLIISTFLTLDGVMQAPGGPGEDDRDGFTHGGWSVHFWDEGMGEAMARQMSSGFDLVLGRRTYDIFAAHWPHAPEDEAKPLNDATKYVASRGTPDLSWRNSQQLEGDVAPAVAALKQQTGPELQVHGSSELTQTLLQHQLVDEFRLWIFPVVLGSGRQLFADGAVPSGLELTSHEVSSTGVIMTTYVPTGDVPIGSFMLE